MKIKSARLIAILSAITLGVVTAGAQTPVTPVAPPEPAGPAAQGGVTPVQPPAPAKPAAEPVPTYSPEDQAEARVALAERFCDMAMSLAKATRYSSAGLRQSAILLEAAIVMNPIEPRYLRYLGFWREQLGETDRAIAVWSQYRSLLPDDRVVQTKLIDLYLSKQQSNDAKLKYLRELLTKESINDDVKAHVAARAVPLLDQRSRAEALAMLAKAREYYPLPEVTLMEWQMLPRDATPVQRFTAMLNVLRANPTNTEAIGGVANMLAENGLSERALTWYNALVEVNAANQTEPSEAYSINYIAERYRAGETTFANDQLDKILQKYPDDEQVWFLRLTTQRSDESIQMLRQAQQIFNKRLSDDCDAIMKLPLPSGVKPAPVIHIKTNPPTATPPSEQVQAAITRARQLGDPRVTDKLVETLGNLIWFELYYDHKADLSVPSLIALKELRPINNFLVRRLDGWYDFVSGNETAARAIFTAEQAKDPLSALGLFAMEDAKGHTAQANAIGASILSDPHIGVMAAILFQATKGRGIKPANPPPNAEALRKELDQFPKDLLDVVHVPGKFYSIRAEPVKVGHRLGEAMLAVVTIQNESKEDICIGEQGLIKPVLCFDGWIRGINAAAYPAVAFDRILGRSILRPTESVSEIVRIDNAALSEALHARPAVLLLLNASVITNARPEQGVTKTYAGGYARVFGKMFTRNPAPLAMDAARRKLFADLGNGSPESKILDLELLAAYYNQYIQPQATDNEMTFAQQFLNFIDKSRSDPAPGVKLWSSYTYAVLTTGNEERRALSDMLESTSWESRLLALYASQNLPVDTIRQIATKATTDKDPLVKAYATGLLELLKDVTTRPTTLPSGAVFPGATTRPAAPATTRSSSRSGAE
ncbi:MAG TPA: hypothetical protein VFE47_26790 [Tepidisphaeraceae bacterium]|nr:hypothetical protein [Tepidisphaeraceae bacterium]